MKKLLRVFFLLVIANSVQAETGAVPFKRVPPKNYTSRNFAVKPTRESLWAVGVRIGFDGLWGKVSGNDVLSKGLGYSAGLSVNWQVTNRFRLNVTPSYQYMRLGRPIDGSGQLADPNPANFEQSLRYLGVTALGGYRLNPYEMGLSDPEDPQWWLELGGAGLFPLSASQTVAESSRTITGQKAMLLLLGASGDFSLNPSVMLMGSLHAMVNLAGNSDGRFYGLQALVSAYYRL